MYAKIVHIGKVNLDHTFDTKELWEKSTHYPQRATLWSFWTNITSTLCLCHSMLYWFSCNFEDSSVPELISSLATWVCNTNGQTIHAILLYHNGVSRYFFLGLQNAEVIFCFVFLKTTVKYLRGSVGTGKCHSFVKHRGQLVVESVFHSWNTGVSW